MYLYLLLFTCFPYHLLLFNLFFIAFRLPIIVTMDLSDEDFYDSEQSDVDEQSLHAILKKTLYDKDNEFEDYGELIAGEEEALGSVQEEVLGKITDNGTQEEVVLGPISSKKNDPDENEQKVSIETKLDEAEEVVLAPEVLGELEKKHFFDGLDDDDFEPVKKKQKKNHEGNDDENPHKMIIMHVPQFIRCNKGGQSIQVQ